MSGAEGPLLPAWPVSEEPSPSVIGDLVGSVTRAAWHEGHATGERCGLARGQRQGFVSALLIMAALALGLLWCWWLIEGLCRGSGPAAELLCTIVPLMRWGTRAAANTADDDDSADVCTAPAHLAPPLAIAPVVRSPWQRGALRLRLWMLRTRQTQVHLALRGLAEERERIGTSLRIGRLVRIELDREVAALEHSLRRWD